MPRSLPAHRLSKSPLIQVLAQVRFPTVFGIKDSIVPIQLGLKGLGFPRFERSALQRITIEGGAPRMDSVDRWDFLDRDKRMGVILTQEFVLLQTNRYSIFESFRDTLKDILGILAANLDIPIAERLGLRYVDLIRPSRGESFADYLDAGLVGFPFARSKKLKTLTTSFRTESSAKTPVGQLAIRCLQSEGGSFLPPDLIPSALEYDLNMKAEEVVATLDFDHFTTKACDFDAQKLIDSLDDLHDAVDIAFREAVTPHVMKQWGQESL